MIFTSARFVQNHKKGQKKTIFEKLQKSEMSIRRFFYATKLHLHFNSEIHGLKSECGKA